MIWFEEKYLFVFILREGFLVYVCFLVVGKNKDNFGVFGKFLKFLVGKIVDFFEGGNC